MPAGIWNFDVEQGSLFRVTVRLRDESGPVVLTGYAVEMEIRENVSALTPVCTLTSAPNGGIVLDGPAGTMTITIPDEVSADWDWRFGVYSLEIQAPNGDRIRLLKGEATLDREVVR